MIGFFLILLVSVLHMPNPVENLVTNSTPVGCYVNTEPNNECPYDDITFWYHNQNLKKEGIQFNETTFKDLPIQDGAAWKITFHGFGSSKDMIPNPELLEAYSNKGEQINILVLDYQKPFSDPSEILLCYEQAANVNLELVGRCVYKVLQKLIQNGSIPKPDKLHLIGHSLGAHTAAYVAKKLQKNGTGKVFRLTGLDPAGPLFNSQIRNQSTLSPNDATFVDVHHSNAGILGTTENLGIVDIWYNGGTEQPGCNADYLCNHFRSADYYAESIFPLSPNYFKFLATPRDNSTADKVLVGEYIDLFLKGVFDISTNAEPPYAKS